MKQIDRIRNMNAEEMARLMVKFETCWNCGYSICDNCILIQQRKAWLESEVEE